jgi:hypothetical protein
MQLLDSLCKEVVLAVNLVLYLSQFLQQLRHQLFSVDPELFLKRLNFVFDHLLGVFLNEFLDLGEEGVFEVLKLLIDVDHTFFF